MGNDAEIASKIN